MKDQAMEDKIIVTNRKGLRRKYRNKGFATIRKALAELRAADKKRGSRAGWYILTARQL